MTRIETVRTYIVDELLYGDANQLRSDSQSMGEGGVLDSTAMMELVVFLETQFGVEIEDDELVPENLDSLDRIDQYLTRKLDSAR